LARKILLADDSVTAQNMGRRILTDAGYEVITVNNGSAAMKKINEIKPDLIVLDIYMPGYGGLEICQRIRETPELARIPVLLTVGKLEPFKADDAKRVRADAFVIKPFEASELLTALTKLEDKIVPSGLSFSGGSFTGGRFARAVASLEEMKAAKEFGDTDTGWKSRLKIPAPYSKPHEAHVESQASAPNGDRAHAAIPESGIKPSDLKVDEKVQAQQTGNVASILPEAVASSLPHNVTPEEIEAIAAAAALLASHADISADAPLGSHRHADVQEKATAVESTIPTTLPSSTDEAPNAQSVPEVAETKPVTEYKPEISRAEPAPQTQHEVREDEVAAMLASLSPTISDSRAAEVEETIPVTMAAGVGAEEYSGPRWIAEETPVSEEESALVLQLEMERTFAAFAAADAARVFHVEHFSKSGTAEVEESAPEISRSAEIASPAAVAPTARADISAVEDAAAAEPNLHEADSSPKERDRNDNVGPDSSLQEQLRNDNVVDHPGASVPQEAAVDGIVPPQEEKAAYAVASAGWGTSDAPSTSEYPARGSPAEVSAALPPSDLGVENRNNELAAAWATWKQVRESEAGPQATAEAAEFTATAVHEPHHHEAQEDSLQADLTHADLTQADDAEPSEAEASAEAAEVASIVESVLADLKPKLMREIAQKMGKGKKKKKKTE
jgi:CheY-like chemotaxis protein